MLVWALAIGLAAAPSAASSPPPVDLHWNAPSSCPDVADVRAMVKRFTPPGLESSGAQAWAQVARTDQQWRLNLRMRFTEGEVRRELEAETCQVLAQATAVVIAAMLDPTQHRELLEPISPVPPDEPRPVPAPPSPSPSSAESTPPPIPPSPSVPRRPRSLRRGLRGGVGLAGLGTFGVLPRVGGAVAGLAALEGRGWRTELRTTFDSPQRAFVPGSTGGARILLWSGAALACYVPHKGLWAVPLCAGPELGWLRARGEGLEQPLTVHRLLVDVNASLAFAYALRPKVRLRVQLDGLFVVTPHRFFVRDLGVVHRTRRGGLRAGLGLEWVFGQR